MHKYQGPMRDSTKNIACVIELSRKLLFCADRGDIQRRDESCGVLFGMTRDCAYKILDLALRERIIHIKKGIWDMDDAAQFPGYKNDNQTV